MQILYLSRQDIESLGVGMREVLEVVDRGFRLKGLGRTEMPAKIGIHPITDAFIHAMPAYVKEVEAAGLKWVSGFPSNIAKGLPYITGLLILNDPTSGVPQAIMDGAWITAMRTGASAGISSKYLARPESCVAAFCGCGVQARTSLMALVETLPDLAEARCYDLFPAAAVRFIKDMGRAFPQLRFHACDTATAMIRGAQVVVTAIPIVTKPQPPLDADMLEEGGLAVSLDYDSAWTSAAMRQCTFCSDDVPQLLETQAHGVYFAGIPGQIYADLGELAAGLKPGRQSLSERIFSMNMGIAVDDIVTAHLLFERAREQNVGTWLPL